jgi:succinyl-diaminopimelate desuccinylase
MKGGVAVQLALAAALTDPVRDVTYVFYDHEEVEASLSGLGRLAEHYPEWLSADFAVLLEPTAGTVEGGCNGTARFNVTTTGKAAHSARAWRGENAIHKAAEVLVRLRDHEPATVHVDGLDYRESLNAVLIQRRDGGQRHPGQRCDRGQLPFRSRQVPPRTPSGMCGASSKASRSSSPISRQGPVRDSIIPRRRASWRP